MSGVRTLEEIAYDAAERALDKQEKTVEELRARTGVLLAASSLAVSFLGRDAFSDGFPPLTVAALAGFVGTVAGALRVLTPQKQLRFAPSAIVLYERLHALRDDPAAIHRQLAYDLSRYWRRNDHIVDRLSRAYRGAAAALVVEMLALVVLISDDLL